jgi:hypothetical protein
MFRRAEARRNARLHQFCATASRRPRCSEQESAGLNDVTWSPDGSAIAFDDPAGIEVLSIPSTLSGCTGFAPHRLLVPGGAQPF